MELEKKGNSYKGRMSTLDMGNISMNNVTIEGNKLSADVGVFEEELRMSGVFEGEKFT